MVLVEDFSKKGRMMKKISKYSSKIRTQAFSWEFQLMVNHSVLKCYVLIIVAEIKLAIRFTPLLKSSSIYTYIFVLERHFEILHLRTLYCHLPGIKSLIKFRSHVMLSSIQPVSQHIVYGNFWSSIKHIYSCQKVRNFLLLYQHIKWVDIH